MGSSFSQSVRGRIAVALILAAAAWTAPKPSEAQDYPKSTITLVVPFPAGGAVDQIARIIQPKLQANLGQPVVIENKSGASGTTGAIAVSRAAPDGHTILLASSNVASINSYFFKSPNFNPLQDLAPITTATRGVIGIVVHSSLPIHTFKEFIAYAQKNDVSFAIPGIGTAHHLFGEYLARLAKYKMTTIPYRGSGPATADVVAGHVKVGIFTLPSVISHAATGTVRIIAIGESTPFSGAPNVRTIAETFPGFDISQWNAFYAPPGTPKEIINKLHQELTRVLQDPAIKKALEELATPVLADRPEDLAKRQKDEYERWGLLVREMKIQPQ